MPGCDIHREVAKLGASDSHVARYTCSIALVYFVDFKKKGEAGVEYDSLHLLAAEGFGAFQKYIPQR